MSKTFHYVSARPAGIIYLVSNVKRSKYQTQGLPSSIDKSDIIFKKTLRDLSMSICLRDDYKQKKMVLTLIQMMIQKHPVLEISQVKT